ncbi:hypothetical protein ACFX16_043034 [Malus domestica]
MGAPTIIITITGTTITATRGIPIRPKRIPIVQPYWLSLEATGVLILLKRRSLGPVNRIEIHYDKNIHTNYVLAS